MNTPTTAGHHATRASTLLLLLALVLVGVGAVTVLASGPRQAAQPTPIAVPTRRSAKPLPPSRSASASQTPTPIGSFAITVSKMPYNSGCAALPAPPNCASDPH